MFHLDLLSCFQRSTGTLHSSFQSKILHITPRSYLNHGHNSQHDETALISDIFSKNAA